MTLLKGVSVHKDKFNIMITVGLSYIRKHSWWIASSPISNIWVSSKKSRKFHRLASTAFDRGGTKYQKKIGFLMINSTKMDPFWSFWCRGWSDHQNQEVFWGNWAVEAVEAVEASEVAEATKVNKAGEVFKAWKITTEDFSVFQDLDFNNLSTLRSLIQGEAQINR